MHSTQTLRVEHKLILNFLEGVDREIKEMESRQKVNEKSIGLIMDYFDNFLEKSHHLKEEKYLFPKLVEKGQSGPVSELLREHVAGRSLVKSMLSVLPKAKQGLAPKVNALAGHLRSYAQLLRPHIDKEENFLYNMADSLLSPEEEKELSNFFQVVSNI